MPPIIRWLHLSDFHMGEDAYGQGKIADYILSHVAERNLPLDFIFITGDIGFSGQKNDYTRFQQQFITPMADLIDPSTQWLMVPGNHDVDRVGVKRINRNAMLTDKNAVFEPTKAGLAERKWLLPGLKNYRECLSENWLATDEGVFHHTDTFHGTQVGILGINTAWLSQDDHDKGHLTPGKALVEQGLSQIKDCPIKIVLGHHPIQDWVESDQELIKALFRQYNVLYLHGHLHQSRIDREPEFLTLQAGAAFQGREDAQWKNRLLWGEINQNHVMLTPYVWAAQHQTWIVDGDAFHPRHQIEGQNQWAFELPTAAKRTFNLEPQEPEPEVTAANISLAKLPVVSEQCFGREHALEQLTQALSDQDIGIFTLVAWGGVGKTTLVGHWLNQLQKTGYGNLQRVFGWSFYSQGSAEDRQASSDLFIDAALKWFGADAETGSLWEKGERLAACIGHEPTLLILDGLEPLQYPPGDMQGRLKDLGMQALLRALSHATSGSGLCVVTTRIAVADLSSKIQESFVRELSLEALSSDAGRALLQHIGVQGAEAEFTQVVNEYAGHALALTLLGTYLHAVHGGDILKRDLIGRLTDEPEQGRHAQRVLAAYETWLQAPERRLLSILGLFDRPADANALQALRHPVLAGLTDDFSEAQWGYAIKHLRALKLLAAADANQPEQLDCHPLVREYFSNTLRRTQPEVWKAAHHRLYAYYQALPEKHQPDTLAEMEPLYRAVAHGCLAGCVQEVVDKVYHERIARKEGYSVKKLGAFGPDLAVVAYFFDSAWTTPSADLTEVYQAWVLNLAGFRLRALGRLSEAVKPLSVGLQRYVEQENWKEAASNASNLSELQLTLGQVASAVETGRRGVEYADQSEDWFPKMRERTTLADALLQSGDSAAAQSLFREAEALQKTNTPDDPTLYSLPGFRFCDLLLDCAQEEEVKARANCALEISTRNHQLLSMALDRLTLGRCALRQSVRENTGYFSEAQAQLDQAVAGLREAGQQDDLPRGLLARAACLRAQTNFPAAWRDLQEVHEIAERSGMKLFLTDYHLEAARLCEAQGKPFAEHVTQAKALIDETGYHRRLNFDCHASY